jgi:arginase
MDVEILIVPYDSGHEDLRLGRGHGHLLEGGLLELLRGHEVTVHQVQAAESFRAEIRTTFALCRSVAESHEIARGREAVATPMPPCF